ncbi:MAG: aminoglycoside phosphotransferase family protein [Ruminococcaceae bacterium]|nr:aminoglycoside phosphotransferase family protein [Oscillospiraceae bacterium]
MDFAKERELLKNFEIEGDVQDVSFYGEGHINVTMLVKTNKQNYILQKINTKVFKRPEDVMNNILLVTEHLKKKGVLSLSVIKTLDKKPMFVNSDGCYRVYDFIEDTVTLQRAETKEVFSNAGYSFGEFQNYLDDFDATKLVEIIENFHNTPKRYENFKRSVEENKSGRRSLCEKEVKFVTDREDTFARVTDAMLDGSVPVRVTHNDTKLNNILMDETTLKGKAVIDLDTVMPGSMLYDFGDSIRFGASTAAEDEKDLDKVHFDIDLFRAYAEGFLSTLKDKITPKEKELLPYSAYLMTMECGMRFLGDFIDGDTYFATKYSDHNLVRARTQFALAEEMEKLEEEMSEIIEEICK